MNLAARANPTALSNSTEEDPRWMSILARDAAADGRFVYAVRTTGVYCRPSCPSRVARARNVALFDTCAAAERAGFRACLRYMTNQPSRRDETAQAVTRACRLIEASEEPPSLDELAASAGMSPFHFHRRFKAVTGLMPRAYAAAHRASKIRADLRDSESSVTDAIYAAGYNASSRFYATSNAVLGMTPSAFKKGGDGTDIRFAVGQCSLGAVLVAASPKGICAILLGDDAEKLTRDLQDRFPTANLIGGDAEFEATVARVVGLVEHPATGLDLPLDVRGTAFQQRVWQALRHIPAGQTASYAAVAERIGAPKSVRAVAAACAANAIAVAIPCHRVVRTDGTLSGYRWGIERKRTLLAKEAGANPEA